MSSDEWCSPPEVADPLEAFFEGPVDLDPASNDRSIIRARRRYTAGGLHLPWARTNYENPPYSGDNLLCFTQKGILELAENGGPAEEWVRLVPASTSTLWWCYATGIKTWTPPERKKPAVIPRPLVCFTKRLRFIDELGRQDLGARHESAIFYYGPRSKRLRFLQCFSNIINWSVEQ